MMRPPRPFFAFGVGTIVGTLAGLIGLGGAEFRLPALVGALKFTAREAVPINLASSFVVLATAFPFRLQTVPFAELTPYAPAIAGMLAGSMSAAWVGAGMLKGMPDHILGRAILVLLVALGVVLISEGLFVAVPMRLIPDGLAITLLTATVAGVVIGLVSSLLGVAGGELIIPVFILVFGVDVKLAGSMSMLVGLPTIAVGLIRHLRGPTVLRDGPTWRSAILPLAAGSMLGAALGGLALGLVPGQVLKLGLGAILIWSAFGVFRHLPGHPVQKQ